MTRSIQCRVWAEGIHYELAQGGFTGVLGLIAASGLPYAQAWAQTAPALPATALPVRAPNWQQQGTGATYSVTGSDATVKLSGPATVLNWNSMDVGSKATLNFSMPSSSARTQQGEWRRHQQPHHDRWHADL